MPKAALLMAVCAFLPHRGNLPRSVSEGLLALWLLWPILSPVMPTNVLDGIQARGWWVFYLLVCWQVAPVSPEHRIRLTLGLGWAAIATSVYAILQRMGIDVLVLEPTNQAVGFMGNPNFNAHFLLLAWLLASYVSQFWRYLALGLMAVALVLSESRAALLIWLCCVAIREGKGRKIPKSWLWILFLGIGIFLVWRVRHDGVFFRYMVHPSEYAAMYSEQPRLISDRDPWFKGKRLSLMAREALYLNSCALVHEKPLLGYGPGQFRVEYPRVSQAWVPDMLFGDSYRSENAHHSLLDAAVVGGIPWLALGIWLFYSFAVKLKWTPYSLALGSQMVLSMVSLNYLNPVIVTTLLLVRPGANGASESGSPGPKAMRLLWVVPFAMLLVPAWWKGQAPRETDWQKITRWLPAEQARVAYEQGDLDAAWLAQMRALRIDPMGPDTLFNTGVMAWEYGRAGADQGCIYAVQAYLLIENLYPYFLPARDRLLEIKNAGLWEAQWDALPDKSTKQEDLEVWRGNIFDWRPGGKN